MESKDGLQHEIVADIKRVASEIGRTPGRDAYRTEGKFSDRQVRCAFGGYAVALKAAGFEPAQEKKPKLKPADIFGRDLKSELAANRRPAISAKRTGFKRTVVVGDLHFPFTCLDTLTAFYQFLDENRPERIVQVGDLFDAFAHSKFPASKNIYTPLQEITLAVEMASAFWKKVREICPGIECHGILGNHDVRPLKRILECYPEGEIFFSIDKYYQFPGVTMHMNPRDPLDLDGVLFQHGHYSRLGDHRDYNLQSTVTGHSHSGGVVFRQVRGEILFEMNAGYMGDPTSKALAYTPTRIVKWTKGWGWIDQWGARFIPA